MEQINYRKQNRLKDYDYSAVNYYFITICTNEKLSVFGKIEKGEMNNSFIGNRVNEAINNIPLIYKTVRVDKYVIMPNHIHMILINDSKKNNISTVVGQLKRHIALNCGKDIWQKGFYDHIIRNERDYLRIWEYIDNNILKWELDEYYSS